jgi:hypothetical protein
VGILQPVSGADDRLGSKPAVISALGWVRFTPESSRNSDNTHTSWQNRTRAPQQIHLLDHVVGNREQRRRHDKI